MQQQFDISLNTTGGIPEYDPGQPASPPEPLRPRRGEIDPPTDEKLKAGVKMPAFLPYYDELQTAGETQEMRIAYRQMLADPNIKAAFLGKVFSVMSLDLVVKPPEHLKRDKRSNSIADFLEWNYKRGIDGGVPGMVWDIFSGGLVDGFSVCEKVWGEPEEKGRWAGKRRLAALKPKDVDQDLVLELDEFKNVVGVRGLRYNSGEVFNPSDFVIFRNLGFFRNPAGMSDFRAAYGKYWLLDAAWKLRAMALQNRASPTLVGHYKDPNQQKSLERSLALAKSQNWLTAPEAARIEALNLAGQADQIFDSSIKALREEIVIAIKGAMLSMMTSSDERGNSEVHKDSSDLFGWQLSAAFLNVLNDHDEGLNRHITDVNFAGVGDYSVAAIGGVDDKELGESLKIDQGLQQMGWPLSIEEIEDRYGRKYETDPAKLLRPQMQGGPAAPGQVPPGGDPNDPNGGAAVGPDGQPVPGGNVGGQPNQPDAAAGAGGTAGGNAGSTVSGGAQADGDQDDSSDEKHQLIAEILAGLPGGDQAAYQFAEAVEMVPVLATVAPRPPREFASTQFDLAEAGYPRSQGNPAEEIFKMATAIPAADLSEKGIEFNPHITVKYGLHADSADEVQPVIANFGPVAVTLGKTSFFRAGDGRDFDVVKVDVAGERLYALNKLISESLECADTYPEYKPHITIAYVKPGLGAKYAGALNVEGQQLLFDLLTFSAKDRSFTILSMQPNRTWKFAEVVADDAPAEGDEADWVLDPEPATFAEWDESKHPRADDGRFSKSAVAHARKQIATGKQSPKSADKPFPSALSGKPIRRYVEMPDGSKIHPDELHRIKHGDDGEHYLSTNEMLTVIDGSGKPREAKSFAHAIASILPTQKAPVTIQGPHGYSATLSPAKWKALGDTPGTFAEWLDAQNPDDLKADAGDHASLTTIATAKETDDFFAPRHSGQGFLFAESAGRWITIGGKKGEDGKRHGGTPVFIENGRITKGAPSLTGKRIDALNEAAEGFSVRKANAIERGHSRATWAKKAKAEGVDPKHLHHLAAEMLEHDRESKAPLTGMLSHVREQNPWVKGIGVNARHGIDQHSIKAPAGERGLDQIAQELAHSKEFGHLFGGADDGVDEDHTEKLFDYLVHGSPDAMDEDDAYEQALRHLIDMKAWSTNSKDASHEAVPFAEGDWSHDPGPRSKNRWKNVKTGRIVYSATNPGAGRRKSAVSPTDGTSPAAGGPAPTPRSKVAAKPVPRSQAQANAKAKIRDILAGNITPESHQELLGHLSTLTIPQLKALRDEHQLKAGGKRKAELVQNIGSHFKGKMLATGSVDVDALRTKLKSYEETEIPSEKVQFARAKYEAAKSQYGSLLVHRLNELADEHLEELADLPKGAKVERKHHAEELAIVNWMLDKAHRDGIDGKVEDASLKNFGANMDRIAVGERLKRTPWSAFLLKSIRERFNIDKDRNDEQIFNDLKEGKFKGPRLDEALKALRADYGTVTQKQLFEQVLPSIKSRRDYVSDNVDARPAVKTMASAARSS